MTAIAIAERGEVTLPLDGTDYVLRPTFAACSAIETQTGRSLTELLTRADDRTLSMAEAGIIATEFIRAWGRETQVNSVAAVQTQRVTELIYEGGIARAVPRLTIVLLAAVTGGAKRDDRDAGDNDAGEASAAGTEPAPAAD